MANIAGFIPDTQLITSAAQRAGDPKGEIVGRTRYRDFLASGLRNLCFNAEWDRRYHDVAIPANRIIVDMPQFISGLRSVWLYSSNTMCNPQLAPNSIRAHLKDNYFIDSGGGAFQDNQWFNWPDATQNNVGVMEPLGLFYFGFRGGKLYLSPQCSQFNRVRIDYTGVGLDKYCPEEEMQVPIWAVEALEVYVAMRACEHLIGMEGKTSEATYKHKLFYNEYNSPRGAWSNALMFWAGCDAEDRKDVVTMISYMGFRH